jgi:hypothetical protein
MHSTDELNDGYLGSGTLLKRSINKHGKENHSIEILEFVNSREELAAREREIITLQEIAKKECMNLKVGGSGGNVGKGGEHLGGDSWAAANRYWKTEEGLKKKSETAKEVIKRRIKEGTWNVFEKGHKMWEGKNHRPETIEKMKISKISHGVGEKNSQYGKPRSEETKQKIRESLKKSREAKNKN